MHRIILVIATTLIVATPRFASATSFDCSKATTATEKVICSDAELGALDEKLSALYESDLVSLSESGQQALRASQREWLQHIRLVCSDAPGLPRRLPVDEPPYCLKREYGYRLKQLSNLVSQDRGFSFLRVETFSEKRAKDDNGGNPGFVTTHIAYPQIDQPRGETTDAYNTFIKRQIDLRRTGPGTDLDISYEVSAIGPRAVSTTIIRSVYPHGAAHGQSSTAIFTWFLDEKRLLRAEDLFDSQKNWEEALAQGCFEGLQQKHRLENVEYSVKDPSELDSMVTRPDRWTFGPEGLAVQFLSYEVGGYVSGQPNILVPWEKLRPFLVKDPPIDVRK